MKTYHSPVIICQKMMKSSAEEIFHIMSNPEFAPLLWFAEVKMHLINKKILEWKWEITDTSTQIIIDKIIPHTLISTTWQDTMTTVDFEFCPITDNRTLVTFKAYGFREIETDLWQVMKDKESMLAIAMSNLEECLVSPTEEAIDKGDAAKA